MTSEQPRMAQPLFEPAAGTSYSASQLVVILCSTLAMYNGLELLVLIFTTFRRYRGLYFWSLLVASSGILPYNIGFIVEYFQLTEDYAGVIIDVVGWITMVTGQSMVLYSRLHLVLQNPRILRAVLWMIIVDGVVFHVSTTVVRFGGYYGDQQQPFRAAWNVIEKFQMTGFTVQESIISGLYLYETVRLLRVMKKNNTRRTVWELFIINIFIIGLDIGLLIVEYLDFTVYEQTFKGVIYSIKLKLEFAILSKLVKIVRQGNHVLTNVDDTPDFVDVTRNPSDTTHAAPVEQPQRLSVAVKQPSFMRGFKGWRRSSSQKEDMSIQHVEKAAWKFQL